MRDKLLGLKPKDLDYAVEAESFEAMEDWIRSLGGEIFLSSPEFFTSRARVPGHEQAADYVLCRREGAYRDGRRPDVVEVGDIYDDLARRDFTVNAMAQDPATGDILDPYNGQRDLKDMVLACVGDPRIRFGEDYLRIIRAMRFAITKGFDLDDSIIDCFHDDAMLYNLRYLSAERIYEEMKKCFAENTKATFRFLEDYPYLRHAIFFDCKMELSIKNPTQPKKKK